MTDCPGTEPVSQCIAITNPNFFHSVGEGVWLIDDGGFARPPWMYTRLETVINNDEAFDGIHPDNFVLTQNVPQGGTYTLVIDDVGSIVFKRLPQPQGEIYGYARVSPAVAVAGSPLFEQIRGILNPPPVAAGAPPMEGGRRKRIRRHTRSKLRTRRHRKTRRH